MYGGGVHSGGTVCGIGVVSGREAMLGQARFRVPLRQKTGLLRGPGGRIVSSLRKWLAPCVLRNSLSPVHASSTKFGGLMKNPTHFLNCPPSILLRKGAE